MLSFQVIDHTHPLIISLAQVRYFAIELFMLAAFIAVYIESVDHHATLRKFFTYDE